jgi:hypothetical protein
MRNDYFKVNEYLSKALCLEISPLCSPILTPEHPNTRFLDICSKAELMEKYRDHTTVDKNKIVDVHYVHKGQPYHELVGADRFDLIVASHVIEHIPNVLKWLNDLALILKDNGVVKLVIPDQRYCFDFRRRLTGVADILAAYLENRVKPGPERVYDYILFARGDMNNPQLHHEGKYPLDNPNKYEMHDAAYAIAKQCLTEYIDVHCSVWTPHTFTEQMNFLSQKNLLHLQLVESETIFTQQNSFEFFVTFRRK